MRALPPALEQFFRSPRHGGAVPAPTRSGRASNAACGDELVLEFELVGGRIARAGFRARGCSGVIAVADVACEAVRGLSPAEALALDLAGTVAGLGGLPPARRHALEVVRRALEQACDGE